MVQGMEWADLRFRASDLVTGCYGLGGGWLCAETPEVVPNFLVEFGVGHQWQPMDKKSSDLGTAALFLGCLRQMFCLCFSFDRFVGSGLLSRH